MDLSLIIPESRSGHRLDQVVAAESESLSRSRAASLISRGLIRVDGKQKRPGYRVRIGETVSGPIESPDDPPFPVPEHIPLSVLHEDSHILVVDKPAGLVVHPGPGHTGGTLVNALLAHTPVFKDRCWDPFRPGIVHRLDRETSGVILIAKSPSSLEFLQKEFKQRRVEKRYLALAQGRHIPDNGIIELPIGRHPKDRKRMAVLPHGGKDAKTGFSVRRRFKDGALVDVRLYTGRTHQIRVHFYDQGMPLFGDRVYQARRFRRGGSPAPRQMLHAWRLSVRHPYSGRRVTFEAPVPEDFHQIMRHLE